jgi:hypothetical protein
LKGSEVNEMIDILEKDHSHIHELDGSDSGANNFNKTSVVKEVENEDNDD